jgi:hypothetical protein
MPVLALAGLHPDLFFMGGQAKTNEKKSYPDQTAVHPQKKKDYVDVESGRLITI